jgi:hypothetical protein
LQRLKESFQSTTHQRKSKKGDGLYTTTLLAFSTLHKNTKPSIFALYGTFYLFFKNDKVKNLDGAKMPATDASCSLPQTQATSIHPEASFKQ